MTLRNTNRIITGLLKPMSIEKIQIFSGIAFPDRKEEVATMVKRTKQTCDRRYPVFEDVRFIGRFKSRRKLKILTPSFI